MKYKLELSKIVFSERFTTATVAINYQNKDGANFHGNIEIEIVEDLTLSQVKKYAVQQAEQMLHEVPGD